jgi:c(7)-type cytochrome triheme protein
MRSLRARAALAAAIIASVVVVGTAFAQGKMPNLPKPFAFAKSADSPGTVTFTHASHVDENAPNCTACHPKIFKILKAGTTTDGKAITHDAMKKGQACGTCHNGTKSFGFDDCTMCHRGQ